MSHRSSHRSSHHREVAPASPHRHVGEPSRPTANVESVRQAAEDAVAAIMRMEEEARRAGIELPPLFDETPSARHDGAPSARRREVRRNLGAEFNAAEKHSRHRRLHRRVHVHRGQGEAPPHHHHHQRDSPRRSHGAESRPQQPPRIDLPHSEAPELESQATSRHRPNQDRSPPHQSPSGDRRRSYSYSLSERTVTKVTAGGAARPTLGIPDPLSARISASPLPRKYKNPTIKPYLGVGDPLDHVQLYKNVMLMQGADEATLCRGFRNSLEGPAVSWYNGLAPQSIDSFDSLTAKFMQQFLAGRKRLKASYDLFSVKQREGESLRAYFERFCAERLTVEAGDEQTIMAAFKTGTTNRNLGKSFLTDPPVDLEATFARVALRIRTEEKFGPSAVGATASVDMPAHNAPHPGQAQRQNHQGRGQGNNRGGNHGGAQQGGNGGQWRGGHQNQGGAPQVLQLTDRPQQLVQNFPRNCPVIPDNVQFTPLTCGYLEVFAIARAEGYLPFNLVMNRRARDAEPRGREKFCQYHSANGHLTEECVQLKKDIERLIRGGHLRQFVATPRHQRQETPAPAEEVVAHVPPVGGFLPLNTIVGGLSAGGTSSSARKAYCRQILTTAHTAQQPRPVGRPPLAFYDSDRAGILSPHTDALVIIALIGTFEVKRLLVDTGSACDVLFLDTIKRMNLANPMMEACPTPLTGFTGDSVPVIGVISLPVSLGSEPCVVTRINKFVVVDVQSAYNGIIGRPYLEAIEAAPSIACLKMKFHTPHGVGEVKGCQRRSRECYLTALKMKKSATTLTIDVYDGHNGGEARAATIDDVEKIMMAG